jgi:hypothetical protein
MQIYNISLCNNHLFCFCQHHDLWEFPIWLARFFVCDVVCELWGSYFNVSFFLFLGSSTFCFATSWNRCNLLNIWHLYIFNFIFLD